MKKLILQAMLVCAGVASSSFVLAQVSEAFNTRPEASNIGDIKPFLQDHCWTITDMDVNNGGWNPAIDGDGGLVSGTGASSTQLTGISTPFLSIPGNLTISFKYKFNANVTDRRWFKLYLTDYAGNVNSLLDSVELTGKVSGNIYTYNNTIYSLPSGPYKLYINYQGIDGNCRMAIDQLTVSAPYLYNGGCNHAPIANDDFVPGQINHTASGQVTTNDSDPDDDYYNVYMITNSPDGTVNMSNDGNFTFVPNSTFAGGYTTFTYQICDYGYGPLCSNVATVKITFPSEGGLPVRLIDFMASLNEGNEVNIRWTTTMEQGSRRFEIERSVNGVDFEKIGEVKAAGNSSVKTNYEFDDVLKASIANKKDVYYRLRMVDVNSRSEVSKILVIRIFKTKSTQMISVSPNPVRNDIAVQVQLKESSYVVMKVTNSSGLEVARKSLRGNTGLNVYSLDGTSQLIPGVYMLEVIINSNERMTTRLVKN